MSRRAEVWAEAARELPAAAAAATLEQRAARRAAGVGQAAQRVLVDMAGLPRPVPVERAA